MTDRPQMRAVTQLFEPEPEYTIHDYMRHARLVIDRFFRSTHLSLIRALVLVPIERPMTMAIDQYCRVYYNPKFAELLMTLAKEVSKENPCPTCGDTHHHKLAYLGGVLLHEAEHARRRHSARFQSVEMENYRWLFNKAADLEINDDIPEMGKYAAEENSANAAFRICIPTQLFDAYDPRLLEIFGPPDTSKMTEEEIKMLSVKKPLLLVPKSFKLPEGLTAEQYFFELMKRPEENKPDKQSSSDHGSAVDGEAREWEEGPPGEGNSPGVSDAELTAIRREVAQKIVEQAQKHPGKYPAGMVRSAELEIQAPKRNYARELTDVIRAACNKIAGENFTTFRKPSRTSLIHDFAVIKPSTYNIVPNIMIVQDTSGSMGGGGKGSRLSGAMSEVMGIIKAVRAGGVRFIDCDAKAYGVQTTNGNLKNLKLNGGGGTDMSVGVRYAAIQKPRPDMIILVTDGETPYPIPSDLKGARFAVVVVNENPEETIKHFPPTPGAKILPVPLEYFERDKK